jgi:thiamine biosynthesis lipoprotein ApbE
VSARRRTPAPTAWALAAALAAALPAETVRLSSELLGEPATIEISGLPAERAEPAARAAWVELARTEADTLALADAFRRAAGGPVRPDAAAFAMLAKTDSFCRWSEGAVSALGGRVLRAWGAGGPSAIRPAPGALADAVASARCDRLSFDRAAGTVTASSTSEVDLAPFAPGWAVDRAAAALAAAGVESFRVAVGPVARGAGPGPDGKGWRVEFPPLGFAGERLEGFLLRDRAAGLLVADDRPLEIAGDRMPRWLDLRDGRARGGVQAVAAVTDLALDAHALAWALWALGPRAGQMSLGQLRPEPGVLWALGSGDSPPILVVANWSSVPKR